uniref:Angio-associated migratory cell protein n=1 Tax=Plectus sambesii TaxID=2011161 RepID=A0A914XNF7_9BILA
MDGFDQNGSGPERPATNEDGDDIDELNEEDIVQIVPLEDFLAADGRILEESADNDDDDDDDEIEDGDMDHDGEEGEEGPSDEVDDAMLTLRGHSKDVFSVHAVDGLLASGGEDDHALLWSLSDNPPAEPQLVVEGHSDSVTFVRFNSKGTLLASGDMSGKIIITNVAKKERVAEYEDMTDLEWLQWHHGADILFAGGGDSMVWMWLIANGQSKVFAGAGPGCTTGCLLPDGKRLLTGYEDGSVRIWTLKDGTHSGLSGAQGHVGPVVSLDAHPTLAIGASGGQDGSVAIFQTDSGKITSVLRLGPRVSKPQSEEEEEEVVSTEHSVEALAFAPTLPWLVTGTNSGSLILWDLNTGAARQNLQHPNGVVKCLWTDTHTLLSVGLDGVSRLWDARDGHVIHEWHGAGQEIFDVTFNPTKNLIATGSRGGNIRIFQP